MTTRRPALLSPALLLASCVLCSAPASGAALPAHRPLRILVVSDTVNPHGLSSPDLTEGLTPGPGDIGDTLVLPGTGILLDAAVDAVREIPTNDIEQATQLLSVPACDPAAYDVLIYFSHRIPDPDAGKPQSPATRQNNFTAAVDSFLTSGGGLVAFHHGAYTAAGKTGILDLIGGTAGGPVPWDTVAGQDVLNVAPGHFVTTQGVDYGASVAYQDLARGVANGVYDFFNNTPDERYPFYSYNGTAGMTCTLFASNYNDNGSTHLLGFTHRRSTWGGIVVAYQPGEYQPHALDDLDGNNFQILANAILYAAEPRVRNDLSLQVGRGPAPGEVTLTWSPGQPAYSVYRSTDPVAVSDRCARVGATVAPTWTETPPEAELVFYQIAGP